MIAYKRSKNIKDILVKAKISSKRRSKRICNGFVGCKRSYWEMCLLCALIPKEGFKTHKCYKTKEIFDINANVTCVSKNVIYKISCKKCPNFVYIGETGQRFCDRFSGHRADVHHRRVEKVVAEHFNKPNHKYEHMLPMIIEQVKPFNDGFLRSQREKFWINKYQAIDYGANKRF